MGIAALLPQTPIEAFHLAIAGRFARAAEVELDGALVGSFVDKSYHLMKNRFLQLGA
jgi:hypothetical protein